MPYTNFGKTVMLQQLARLSPYVGLHSGTPSIENEIVGHPYERGSLAWETPVRGVMEMNGKVEFAVPEGARVSHAGVWSSARGGSLLAWGTVDPMSFEGLGLYVLDSAVLDLNLETYVKNP